MPAKSKSLGQIFEGRWEYKGNCTFVNIYNQRTFTANESSTRNILLGNTTISALITLKLNNGVVTRKEFCKRIYAANKKKEITI